MPSSRASAFTALGGTEKCCHTPGKSVKRRSIIWTFASLIAFTRSSDVAQFGNMASLLWWRTASLDRVVIRAQVASTYVRPPHELHRVFNMAPSPGQLHLAL